MQSAPLSIWLKVACCAFSGHYSDCRLQKSWLLQATLSRCAYGASASLHERLIVAVQTAQLYAARAAKRSLVPTARFELAHLTALAPQASVSTNSTTSATDKKNLNLTRRRSLLRPCAVGRSARRRLCRSGSGRRWRWPTWAPRRPRRRKQSLIQRARPRPRHPARSPSRCPAPVQIRGRRQLLHRRRPRPRPAARRNSFFSIDADVVELVDTLA